MKRALLAAAAALGLALLAAVGYVVHLLRSLDTPEFKARVLAGAKAIAGTEVGVKDMEIHLLSGVTLTQPVVANPAPFSGNLLTADEFELRYRLWPLLAGRVEVDEVRLEKPALALTTDAQGRFNYERLGTGQTTPGARRGAASAAVPFAIVLRRLAVTDATILMADHRKASILSMEDADFGSSFTVGASGVQGRGKATVAGVRVADMLRVTGLSSPLELTADTLRLAPVRGRLAEGNVRAEVSVKLKESLRWTTSLDVEGADVARLLAEARAKPTLAGRLGAKASFEGGAGLHTVTGKGQAHVEDCAAKDVRLLALLSAILGLPELANPDFDECRAEFVLKGSRLQTPAMSMKGALVRLSGRGSADLRTSALDYDMRLHLAKALLDRVPAKELRAAFEAQADGFGSTDFKVTGTFGQPQTDLTSRIGKAAAGDLLKGGLQKLFGKKQRPSS